jgi:hypothetical protein
LLVVGEHALSELPRWAGGRVDSMGCLKLIKLKKNGGQNLGYDVKKDLVLLDYNKIAKNNGV